MIQQKLILLLATITFNQVAKEISNQSLAGLIFKHVLKPQSGIAIYTHFLYNYNNHRHFLYCSWCF